MGGIIILQKCSTSAEGFNTFRNHLTLPSLTLTIGKCEIPTKFAENVVPLFIADVSTSFLSFSIKRSDTFDKNRIYLINKTCSGGSAP